jgi:hypothetical protein
MSRHLQRVRRNRRRVLTSDELWSRTTKHCGNDHPEPRVPPCVSPAIHLHGSKTVAFTSLDQRDLFMSPDTISAATRSALDLKFGC